MIRRQALSRCRCMCTRHELTGPAIDQVKEKRSQQKLPGQRHYRAMLWRRQAYTPTSLHAYKLTRLHAYKPTRPSTSAARNVAQERRWENNQHTKRVEHPRTSGSGLYRSMIGSFKVGENSSVVAELASVASSPVHGRSIRSTRSHSTDCTGETIPITPEFFDIEDCEQSTTSETSAPEMLTHMRFRHPSLNEGRHECLFVYRPAALGKCEIETLVPSHSDASMATAEQQVTLLPKCRIRSSCGSMEAATSASLGPLAGIPDSAVFLRVHSCHVLTLCLLSNNLNSPSTGC